MPAERPVNELIKRSLLDQGVHGSYQYRYELFENFENRPILQASLDPATINQAAVRLITGANRHWSLAGTNAAEAGSALHVDGGISLATAGADNDQMLLQPATAINSVAQSPWNTVEWEPEHSPFFEAVIELPAITALVIHAGWVLTAALDLTTDANQAKIQFSTEGATSTTNWTAAESIAGTDTETDLGVAAEASKTIRLGVQISDARVPRYYINGVLKGTGSALTAGANLIPFLGIQALAAAAKSVYVRSIKCSRLLTAA